MKLVNHTNSRTFPIIINVLLVGYAQYQNLCTIDGFFLLDDAAPPEIYTMMRAFVAEGDKLSPETVRERIEGFAALWAVRFMGDTPGRFN